MAAPKAPLLDVSGKRSKDVTLTEDVFAAAWATGRSLPPGR